MATEATTQATTETTEKEKVTFTDAQQEKIQEIINSRMGAAGRAAKEEAAAAKAEAEALRKELEEAKKTHATKGSKAEKQEDIDALKAKIAEFESVGKNAHSEIERLNKLLADKDKLVQEAKVEALNVKKQSAIQAAAGKHQFVDISAVTKLTSDSVVWDDARTRWVVVNESGQERMNSSYEPMTLDEFYAEYAQKNPWTVQSTFRGGTGGTESQKSTLSTSGKYNIEDIFGPKSNSILANKVKMENPKLYASMKEAARAQGLVR